MIVREYTNIEKIARLQKYAKLFAFSLRFIIKDYYEHFNNPYYIEYSIEVEEYNKILEWEEKVQKRTEEKRKEKLIKLNIFQKIIYKIKEKLQIF